MRIAAAFVAAGALAASATWAQTSTPAKPAPETHTVTGVTVEAPKLPTKECSPKDKACINLVIAELKLRYPEQLKRFCFAREMRGLRNEMAFGAEDATQSGTDYSIGPSLKLACANDKPTEKTR